TAILRCILTSVQLPVLEYVGPKYRTFVANMSLAIFYAPFTMLMPWLALGFSHWRHMLGAALAGRFFANICYNIGLQWAAEVLPTVVRAQGVSFIHTMGYVSMLMSPPVVFLSQVSSSLMLIILGVLGLLGGILALFLPETLNHDLPQTLSDGAEFGREQRIWHGPCCGPGSKRVKRPQRLWHQGSSLRTISRDEFRSTKMHRVARIAPRKTHISSQDTLDTEKTIQTYTFEHAKN
ncbi:GL21376, partial [Drosophila persimilis]